MKATTYFRCALCRDYYNSSGTFYSELPQDSDGTYVVGCCDACRDGIDMQAVQRVGSVAGFVAELVCVLAVMGGLIAAVCFVAVKFSH